MYEILFVGQELQTWRRCDSVDVISDMFEVYRINALHGEVVNEI
jgi:hypothetical protein